MYRVLGTRTALIPLALFALEFLYFAYIHSWEIDPHHDGIMYTAAVGVYEGKIPHRDFFAQYGPVTPMIQGIWFRITEPTLFSLKLLASFALALIGTLLYVAIKSRLSVLSAVLLSICWALTGPFGLPWSSAFSTLCILVSLIVLRKTLDVETQRSKVLAQLFLTGSILAIGSFIRIHTLLVYFAIFLGLLLVGQELKYRRMLIFLNFGFFLTLGIILFSLAVHDALVPFLDQSIFWAFENYAGGPNIKLSYFTNLAWIPLFGMLNFIFIRLIMGSKSSKNLRLQLVLSTTLLIYSILLMFSQMSRSGPETLRNPRILAIVAGEKAQFAFNFTILTLFMILVLQAFYNYRKNKYVQRDTTEKLKIMYLMIGVATATQLYPYTDEYHIAFIAPILIVVLVFLVREKSIIFPQTRSINWLLLPLIPMLVVNFYLTAKIERQEFNSKTLAGMYGSWASANSIDQTLMMLEQEAPGIEFQCADGIYAGAGGRYLSVDEKFVYWGPERKQQRSIERVFLCYVDQNTVNSYVESGWKVKFKVLFSSNIGHTNVPTWNVLLERIEIKIDKDNLT